VDNLDNAKHDFLNVFSIHTPLCVLSIVFATISTLYKGLHKRTKVCYTLTMPTQQIIPPQVPPAPPTPAGLDTDRKLGERANNIWGGLFFSTLIVLVFGCWVRFGTELNHWEWGMVVIGFFLVAIFWFTVGLISCLSPHLTDLSREVGKRTLYRNYPGWLDGYYAADRELRFGHADRYYNAPPAKREEPEVNTTSTKEEIARLAREQETTAKVRDRQTEQIQALTAWIKEHGGDTAEIFDQERPTERLFPDSYTKCPAYWIVELGMGQNAFSYSVLERAPYHFSRNLQLKYRRRLREIGVLSPEDPGKEDRIAPQFAAMPVDSVHSFIIENISLT
jgi:hypothetical protein